MKPIEKTIESIKRNAEKINAHTWWVYKEQILMHIEDAEFEINPAPPALDVEGLKNKLQGQIDKWEKDPYRRKR